MINHKRIGDSHQFLDHKERWGGILETPWVSKFQRSCLDGGRVGRLERTLKPYPFEDMLDLCCGLGEYARLSPKACIGIDNSLPHIDFARRHNRRATFILGDVLKVPFKDNSFDAVLLACATHHFSDENLVQVLGEMKRVARRFLIIDDAVTSDQQNKLSRLLYSLDRGGIFRSIQEMDRIFATVPDIEPVSKSSFWSFPGLYQHAVFVFKKGA